jgi:hypothetical protein
MAYNQSGGEKQRRRGILLHGTLLAALNVVGALLMLKHSAIIGSSAVNGVSLDVSYDSMA